MLYSSEEVWGWTNCALPSPYCDGLERSHSQVHPGPFRGLYTLRKHAWCREMKQPIHSPPVRVLVPHFPCAGGRMNAQMFTPPQLSPVLQHYLRRRFRVGGEQLHWWAMFVPCLAWSWVLSMLATCSVALHRSPYQRRGAEGRGRRCGPRYCRAQLRSPQGMRDAGRLHCVGLRSFIR